MKKNIWLCLILILIIILGFLGFSQNVNGFSINEELVILYKVGNNDITIMVEKSKVSDYERTWKWTTYPTVQLFSADGRIEYIMIPEVDAYKNVGWSEFPPITLYGKGNKIISVIIEEKNAYLSTGEWFETYEDANPHIFTYEVFTKSNLSVEQINKMLSKTGLADCGKYFYDMEQNWNVNALFAVAVACHESGNGWHKANSHNYFGFKGSKGWMSFSSDEACIDYFGKLMNKKLYYGKSIEQIAVIYCDSQWASYVKTHMKEKWNRL